MLRPSVFRSAIPKNSGLIIGGLSQAFSIFGTGVKSEPDNKRLKDALDISSWSGCAVRIAQTVVKAGNPANPCGIDARDQFVGGFSMWLPRDSCQQLGPPVVSM